MKRTPYNAILGKDTHGNVIVLDYTFNYGSSTHGATGTVFEIVPVATVAATLAVFDDYAADHWRSVVEQEETELGLSEWAESKFPSDDEKLAYLYDDSYSEIHGDIREAYDLAEDDVINCTGGGRIFPRVLDGMEWLDGKREAFEDIILSVESD